MSILPEPQSSSPRERTRLFSIALVVVTLLQLQPNTSFIGALRNKSIEIKKEPTNATAVVATVKPKKAVSKARNKTTVVKATKTESKKEATNATTVVATAKPKRNKTASKDAHHGTNEKARNKTAVVVKTPKTDSKGITHKSKQKHDKQKSKNDHSHNFNYTAFWEDAMEAAFASLKTEVVPPPAPCPKVYVYELPSKLKDGPRTKTIWNSFGSNLNKDKKFKGYLYRTSQFALGTILEYRLRHSTECRTKDPNKADLFYVPILTRPKNGRGISKQCHKIHHGESVRDALPHLNATNACRHFFALGKGHYNGHSCEGWYHNPIKELNNTQRLAYSHFSFHKSKKNGSVHSYSLENTASKLYPNLASVPYPSSLHFKAKHSTSKMPQFTNFKKRKTLMSFIGKSNHGDTQVRKRIVNACKSYKQSKICTSSDWKPKLATAKAKAVFCLEPAGDSPWRKSLSDDITFGCIPVLFSDLTDDVAPWFWKDWKARARVLVPRNEFVSGRIDLKKLLQSIPPQLLELMQTTLREKARKFQYSVDDDQEDGVRVILDNLHSEALDMEHRGSCGYQ